MIAEVRVTDLAVHEHLLDPALREVIVQEQIGLRIDAGGIEFEADAVFGIESFGKARIADGHEILVFQPADRLAAPASPGIARPCHLAQEAPGKPAAAVAVGDRLIELEVVAPTRIEVAGIDRVSVDPLADGRRDIGPSPRSETRR